MRPGGIRGAMWWLIMTRFIKPTAGEQWLAAYPRFTVLFLPLYCPRAKLSERTPSDVHDTYTRNYQRKR
jgi:hypothetical protein